MTRNEHTAARLASPTGGGFDIVRRGEAVRLDSVAAKIIDRLADEISEQQSRINSDDDGKANAGAGHGFKSQGQGRCSA